MQVPNTNTLDTNGKVQPVLEFHDPAKMHFSPKKINNFSKMALLNPCMKFQFFFGQKHSFEALGKWQ